MVKAFKRLLSIKTIVAHKALYDPLDKALEAS
jgi:hypothetical protein